MSRGVSIKKELGSRMWFTGGRERNSPQVTIADSNYHRKDKDETMLEIKEGEEAVYLSLQTILDIARWAQEE